MAERRMFSKAVVNSARFLRMPQTTRLLYYDLGMSADDDGVVEAFTVLRTTGAAEDDLRVLVSKGYVRILNEDLVSFITDWQQNNQIRKDRYHPSIYSELLVKLMDEDRLPNGLPDDNQWLTEVSIGKDSLVKGKKDKKPLQFSPPTVEEIAAYCKSRGNNVDAQKVYDYYSAAEWKDSSGKPVRNWKQKIIAVWERQTPSKQPEESRPDLSWRKQGRE